MCDVPSCYWVGVLLYLCNDEEKKNVEYAERMHAVLLPCRALQKQDIKNDAKIATDVWKDHYIGISSIRHGQ